MMSTVKKTKKKTNTRPSSAKPGKKKIRSKTPKNEGERDEASLPQHPALKKIYEELNTLKEYKRLLAASGLSPTQEDKEHESDLIIQLKRIEKGLTPKKIPSKKDIKLGRGGRKKRP